jgi:L-threonine kinase
VSGNVLLKGTDMKTGAPLAYCSDMESTLTRQESVQEKIVAIPASAGELVQGQLASGEDFLVTNPVNCFSTVRVKVSPGSGHISIFPELCTKARTAARSTLQFFGVMDRDVQITITSDIPIGKGMASSTADIVGVVEALAQALERSISAEQVSALAISIEPSDGLMYRGTVMYDHRRGQFLEHLGSVPNMLQLIVDTGGEVDTIAFNHISKEYTQAELDMQAEALMLLRAGIADGDPLSIGRAATLSASVNQRLLPQAPFAELVERAYAYGACGVACAHSGTILSLLFAPGDKDHFDLAQAGLSRSGYTLLSTPSIHIPMQSISTW